ncbi:MAG: caspase family protein [Geminicoccaceae bacterium]
MFGPGIGAGLSPGLGIAPLFLWLAALLVSIPISDAAAGRRLALVTGNGAYQHVSALPNPSRDARAVGATLESMGFEVDMRLDLDTESMEKAVRRFAAQSQDAEIALFYYAGHGVQVDGRNYLLPVNAKITQPRDLAYEAITLDSITKELDESGAKLSLVLLDACRDNPLEELFKRQAGTLSRGVDSGSGLAQTQGAAGMLIAYATAPDTVALDGQGEHSPFSQALLEWLNQPGIEVGRLFRRVRERVMDITDGQQVPWVEEAVIGEYYLNGTEAKTASAPDAEQLFWEHVQTIDDPTERLTALQRYTLVFPDGQRVEDARQMRRTLSQNLAASGIKTEDLQENNQGLTLKPVDPARETAALQQEPKDSRSQTRSETTGDPATLCMREAADPLAGSDASGRWTADRRYPLSPSLHRLEADLALKHCQKAFDRAPDNLALEGLLGRSMAAAGRWSEALRHLRPAADSGDAVAQYALAIMYRDGQRVPPDPERAKGLFEQAAASGHIGAAFDLGLAYRDGRGTSPDQKQATAWLTKAAEGGYDWAQYELGRLLVEKADGPPEPGQALDWWRLAAEQGNGRAAAAAGMLLKNGEGVLADPAEASRWLRLAVIQGEEEAERPLAELLLLLGDGVKDEAEAAMLLERGALRRDGRAALLLGEIHARGQSSVADPALAAYWLAAAHESRDEATAKAASTFATLPRSAVIEAVQRALLEVGYDPGVIDGAMGQKTARAIDQYRQASGLPETAKAELSIEFLARLIASKRG